MKSNFKNAFAKTGHQFFFFQDASPDRLAFGKKQLLMQHKACKKDALQFEKANTVMISGEKRKDKKELLNRFLISDLDTMEGNDEIYIFINHFDSVYQGFSDFIRDRQISNVHIYSLDDLTNEDVMKSVTKVRSNSVCWIYIDIDELCIDNTSQVMEVIKNLFSLSNPHKSIITLSCCSYQLYSDLLKNVISNTRYFLFLHMIDYDIATNGPMVPVAYYLNHIECDFLAKKKGVPIILCREVVEENFHSHIITTYIYDRLNKQAGDILNQSQCQAIGM